MALLIPDKTFKIFNSLDINQYFLHDHNPNKISLPCKRTKSLLGVTVHNTEDLRNVEDDCEQYTRATVNGNMNTVRVHFYVDEKCAWQDIDLDYESWHAADGRGDGNVRTLSIECIMSNSTGRDNLKARDNCAKLTAWLLYQNGLTADNVYTHTHWLNVRDGKKGSIDYLNTLMHPYKYCPYYILKGGWIEFKTLVNAYVVGLGGKSCTTDLANITTTISDESPEHPISESFPFKVKIITNSLNVRKEPGMGTKIVTTVSKNYVYTITETKTVDDVNWGKLKSGAGWISLGSSFVTKL